MGLYAKKTNDNFPLIEGGTYPAVCYAVIDLGTQPSDFYEDQHKVWIAFEIPSIRVEIEKDGDKKDLPRVASNFYTLSIHEKSTLGQHLVGWRGRDFTPEEAQQFDISKLVGANCLLGIGVKAKIKGGQKNVITSIAKLMKGMTPIESETQMCYYSISEHGWDFPETIPDGVLKMIKNSNEYKISMRAADNPDLQAAQESLGTQEPETVEDDIPF